MGKIEEAIRQASLHHKEARKHALEAGLEPGSTGPLDRRAPTLYWLQPTRKYQPSREELESHRIIHPGFPEAALNGYKMLRTRVQQDFSTNEWKTLAVTAAHDGAGKTVTATNLAIALASHGGHEVYLVDLDLRNPSIADYLGLPGDMFGLAAYLDGAATVQDLLWDVGVQNLAVLANRDQMADSSERIVSKRMQELYSGLATASRNPIVVFDLPPVLTADDAVAFSPFVDAMLVVVSEGETTRDDFRSALEMLRSANLMGVVLNKEGRR